MLLFRLSYPIAYQICGSKNLEVAALRTNSVAYKMKSEGIEAFAATCCVLCDSSTLVVLTL